MNNFKQSWMQNTSEPPPVLKPKLVVYIKCTFF